MSSDAYAGCAVAAMRHQKRQSFRTVGERIDDCHQVQHTARPRAALAALLLFYEVRQVRGTIRHQNVLVNVIYDAI
jgi:hypothetical protein